MRKKQETLPVVIRYEGKGRADRPDWHLRDIVAIFPTEVGTYSVRTMTCYSSVGQHGVCDSAYASRTKPATPKQVRAMLAELRKVGYKRLRVVSRASPSHFKARQQALADMK